MKYFLLFMGYPRSGHTLVAAILNANPNVICSNQLNIFSNIKNFSIEKIKRHSKNTGTWKDTTQIPHVPKSDIKVIGDKTGHRTTEILRTNPMLLGEFKSIVGVNLKWIHVVRNPYDNLATWARLNHINKLKKNPKADIEEELDIVIEKYILLNDTIEKLRRSENVLTVNHEFVITNMHNTLEKICDFLEISFDPDWRDNVRNSTWKKPRITRNQIRWTKKQKLTIDSIINQYIWLQGYDYGGCGKC